jgi:hypothetical protein
VVRLVAATLVLSLRGSARPADAPDEDNRRRCAGGASGARRWRTGLCGVDDIIDSGDDISKAGSTGAHVLVPLLDVALLDIVKRRDADIVVELLLMQLFLKPMQFEGDKCAETCSHKKKPSQDPQAGTTYMDTSMLSIMKVNDGVRGCRFKCKQNRERTNVRIEGVISKLLVLPIKSLPLRPRVLCYPFLFLY